MKFAKKWMVVPYDINKINSPIENHQINNKIKEINYKNNLSGFDKVKNINNLLAQNQKSLVEEDNVNYPSVINTSVNETINNSSLNEYNDYDQDENNILDENLINETLSNQSVSEKTLNEFLNKTLNKFLNKTLIKKKPHENLRKNKTKLEDLSLSKVPKFKFKKIIKSSLKEKKKNLSTNKIKKILEDIDLNKHKKTESIGDVSMNGGWLPYIKTRKLKMK
jgi:hypothetical protein